MTKTRTETDTFGPIEVDTSRYWGAQAQRSLQNFKIGWEKQPASVVRALGIIKRASAETNMGLGQLDKNIGAAIVNSAQEVIEAVANRQRRGRGQGEQARLASREHTHGGQPARERERRAGPNVERAGTGDAGHRSRMLETAPRGAS